MNAPGRKGCGRVTIVARPVEDVVERIMLRSPLLSRCASEEAERAIHQAALPRHKVHPDPEQAWKGMDIEGRRTWITACLESVIVRPAGRPGTNRFDPTRISVVTRTAGCWMCGRPPSWGCVSRVPTGP